ncbi:hypothetical protein PL11_004365 [Lentilactobacillus curieae]|uniref:Uncharacterized protein n=1 Tax=Lentilactobacillus curieae TaxID=1138822 RepID=A0A1S6QHX6_9LACO|nr:hypothetical protein [Lentilactobacillus curieae]AQW21211.1 hypothetical protein PL11_004365 [Lentilactobacillus curieae]
MKVKPLWKYALVNSVPIVFTLCTLGIVEISVSSNKFTVFLITVGILILVFGLLQIFVYERWLFKVHPEYDYRNYDISTLGKIVTWILIIIWIVCIFTIPDRYNQLYFIGFIIANNFLQYLLSVPKNQKEKQPNKSGKIDE